MRSALHPTESKSITVIDYINEFGTKLDRNGNEQVRPFARCPACGSDMYTRGEANPTVDGVFSHQPDSKHFCPLKQSASVPYIHLPPVDEDPLRTAQLRASFLRNWRHHYGLMKSYLSVLDIFDFIGLIHFADRSGIWSYRHIEENQIPYIFLALREFPPVRSKGKYLRKDWVRFWFDSRVRTFDDLWIHTNGNWLMIKATYANPRNGATPTAKQLKETEIIEVNFDFLNSVQPNFADFVVQKMFDEFGV